MNFEVPEKREALLGFGAETFRKELIDKRYLSPQEAADLAAEVYAVGTEIDGKIGELANDPELQEKYTYNGNYFLSRSGIGLRFAPDGLNLVAHLRRRAADYFGALDREAAVEEVKNYLKFHLKNIEEVVAKWRTTKTLTEYSDAARREPLSSEGKTAEKTAEQEASFGQADFEAQQKREILLGKEAARLRELLEKYIGEEKAFEVSSKAYTLALEADEIVREILADEIIAEKFDHTGKFLIGKERGGQRIYCFDGENLLRSVDEGVLKEIFREDKDEFMALDELRNYLQTRRDQVAQILELIRKNEFPEGVTRLSADAKRFFAKYEEAQKRFEEERFEEDE